MAPLSIDAPGAMGLSPEFQRAFEIAVEAEKKPITQLEQRKSNAEQRLNLLNDIIGKVDGVKQLMPGLNSGVALRDLQLISDEPKVVSGTADKSAAEPGKHRLEVLQLAGGASAFSNGFSDKDSTTLGTGYIRFDTPDGTKDVFIDADSSTLEGVVKAINSAKVGMRASVIRDEWDPDAPYRLLIASDKVGSSENVEFPSFYLAGGEEDFELADIRESRNALIRFEGFEIESPTNEIKDLVPGVSVSLKGITEPGRPATLTVEQDIPKTTVKIKDLVDRLNQVFSFIQQQNTIDEKTPTQQTLGGDYGIRMTQSRLQSALAENFIYSDNRTIRSLADVGIQFEKNGLLKFDEKRFENALNAHFDEVVDLLGGDSTTYGVITKLNSALNTISSTGFGILSNQRTNYQRSVSNYDKQIQDKEKRTQEKIEQLKNRLAKAQASIETLKGQSGSIGSMGSGDALTSQLAAR